MCASGLLDDCGKVRLSDGSDGSIGQACFPSDKELSNWKTDVTTVVGVGNLTSYDIDQSICSNSKLSLLKSEVSLRFLLIAKFLDNVSCFLRLLNFRVVSILGRSFTSLASVFNIVHTFVCGDDVGASTIIANELISDGTVNVNSETKALTCANSQPMSNAQPIFIYTQQQLLVVIL